MYKKFLQTFGFVLIGLTACTTDIDMSNMSTEVGYGTSLVIPVGTAHTTVAKLLDFINTDVVIPDTVNNTCMLWTRDTIHIDTENIKAGDFTKSLVNESVIDVSEKMSGYTGTLPQGSKSFQDINDMLDFDYNHVDENGEIDQRIDSIDVRTAELHVNIDTKDITLSESNYLLIDVEFPGVPDLQERHYKVTSTPFSIDDQVDNFMVRFSDDNTKVSMIITYTFVSDGTQVITDASELTLKTLFRFVDFDKVWGYFGRDEVITSDDVTQDIPTTFFNNSVFKDNLLKYSDPRIRFDIASNVGFPMDFTILSMKAQDANGKEVKAEFMENGVPSESCVIKLRKPQNECDTSLNSRTFDKNDGHTERLFEIIPETFIYSFQVQRSQFTTPEGSWEWQHYLCNPPTIDMYINAEIPFQFNTGTFYGRHDTLACDIETLTGTHGFPSELTVENLNLSFRYDNKLPVKAKAHALMLDSLDNPIYESTEFPIEAAPVDEVGRTTGVTNGEFRMEFVGDDISTIWKAKKAVIVLKVDAQKPEDDMIYFSLDDELTVHVALFVKANIKTDLDTISNIFN